MSLCHCNGTPVAHFALQKSWGFLELHLVKGNAMYFTIYRDVQNQYRWNLKGDNHEPVASGEAYPQKANVLHAVALVNGRNGYRVDDKTQSQGLLDAFLNTQISPSAFSSGLPNAPTAWSAALLGINPQAGGLAGLLDSVSPKK